MSHRKLAHAMLIGCAVAIAQAADAAGLKVDAAWVRGTVVGQMATGAFMELTAKDAAAVVGASSPVAGVVEIHSMKMENGVMKMRPVPRLDLPAGATVRLTPGSYHIMLMDLKQPLKPGERVAITLKLEEADKSQSNLEVQAEVRPPGADLPQAPAVDVGEHRH